VPCFLTVRIITERFEFVAELRIRVSGLFEVAARTARLKVHILTGTTEQNVDGAFASNSPGFLGRLLR
jgi:hypothetical protein